MRQLSYIVAISALLVATAIGADSHDDEYRGKVFTEIHIDDQGIVLIDSAGNVTKVPLESQGEGGSVEAGVDRGSRDYDFLRDCPDVVDKITKIGGSVVVDEDECVAGDVVVIGGNATIRGKVVGNVTATGTVRVAATATVRGNVAGRRVITEPGSTVWGGVTETEFPWTEPPSPPASQGSAAVAIFVLLALEFGAVILVSLLLPKPTDRLKQVYKENIFKAMAVGFVAELLFVPVLILLLITIIGIPVAVLGMPLALLAAALLGFTAFCLYISDFVKPKDESREESLLMKTMTGFVILEAPIIGQFFFQVINVTLASVLFGIVSVILIFIVFTASLGAALLTRLGTRDYPASRPSMAVRVETTGTAEN
jgi:hypothetical protein